MSSQATTLLSTVITILLFTVYYLLPTTTFAFSPNAIIPGEYIVTYKPGQDSNSANNQIENHLQVSLGLQKKKLINQHAKSKGQKASYLLQLNKSLPIDAVVQAYKQLDSITTIEPNIKLHTTALPNDTYTANQWNLSAINLPLAWDITQGSVSVRVAIPDTGINVNHPDLANTPIILGTDFFNGDTDPTDDNGHGTYVAGVIGASTDNQLGISSVAWHVTLISQKILDQTGNGDTALLIDAIDEAVNLGANVINLSLGNDAAENIPCETVPAVQAMFAYANQRGVTIVAAAGNDNADASTVTPASCQDVITAGAIDSTGQRASFSNFGSVVDLAAPGKDIYTIISPTNYGIGYGTSFAAPHVSGVIVLLLSQNPNLKPSDITQILTTSATPITTDQPIGNKLNALTAVQASVIPPTPTPIETPIPNPWDTDQDGDLDFLDFITNLSSGDLNNIFNFTRFIYFYGQLG